MVFYSFLWNALLPSQTPFDLSHDSRFVASLMQTLECPVLFASRSITSKAVARHLLATPERWLCSKKSPAMGSTTA